MQTLGTTFTGDAGTRTALAPGIDTSNIITTLATVKEARALPRGAVVGDLHGGLTFSDSVAAALESRSKGGWQEMHTPSNETWTVIRLDR